MRLLIYEDDLSMIRYLSSAICWDQYQIDEILSATNITQAQDIFRNYQIDLMISDIELPQGTGIELFQWMKNQGIETENIFFTNHSEFSFAVEALRLGSVDYVLKVSDINLLEKAIAKATERIVLKQIQKKYREHAEHWQSNRAIIIDNFWNELLKIGGPLTQEEIAHRAFSKDIEIHYDDPKQLIMISFAIYRQNTKEINENDLIFLIDNMLSELLGSKLNCENHFVYRNAKNIMLFYLVDQCQTPADKDPAMESNLDLIIKFMKNNFACDLNSYIGKKFMIHEFKEIVKEMSDFDMNNVVASDHVIHLSEKQFPVNPKAYVQPPEMFSWGEYLQHGEKFKLVNSVKNYLENIQNTQKINRNYLTAFVNDFNQMVFSVLKQNHISVHDLLSDENFDTMQNLASNSIFDILRWIHYLVNKSVDVIFSADKSITIVGKIKKYIELNYKMKISRQEIAQSLFMNPDYISRIFNKSTGMSITDYIARIRIEKAQQMLNNGLSISDVARECGFDNYSYFSIIFKKLVGLSPMEYLRKHDQ